MRSCRLGFTALDVANQLVAGRVDEPCGGEVVERLSDAVELREGDTGAKIPLVLVERLLISVMDREADFFELFDEQRRVGGVDVLVRAKHDRRLDDSVSKLFATLQPPRVRVVGYASREPEDAKD